MYMTISGFRGGSDGKESACNVEDLGSIPRSGKSPWIFSSILSWRSPWTEEPDGLPSIGPIPEEEMLLEGYYRNNLRKIWLGRQRSCEISIFHFVSSVLYDFKIYYHLDDISLNAPWLIYIIPYWLTFRLFTTFLQGTTLHMSYSHCISLIIPLGRFLGVGLPGQVWNKYHPWDLLSAHHRANLTWLSLAWWGS